LQIAHQLGLSFDPKKCRFAFQSTDCLGHRIDIDGIATDDSKIDIIRNWPTPTSSKQLQRFLGLASYYRRFVQQFASIARPLSQLTSPATKFVWSPEAATAFASLKDALINAPILIAPDYDRPFSLSTDASTSGLGAVLEQERDGQARVIAFASRVLSPAEQNYSTTEQECLAVVWALRKFRLFIDGITTTLYTDHAALQWIFEYRGSNRRLIRWVLDLQEYRPYLTIQHRPGRNNAPADALSRLHEDQHSILTSSAHADITDAPQPINTVSTVAVSAEIRQDIIQALSSDPFFGEIVSQYPVRPWTCKFSRLMHNYYMQDDLLFFRTSSTDFWRLCIPHCNVRALLVHDAHSTPTAGHQGIARTYARLRQSFYWPRMAHDVHAYVSSCISCHQAKTRTNALLGALQPLPIPSDRWEIVTMDFVTGLPMTEEGFDAIFVVTCKLSKRIRLIPTFKDASAVDTASLFFSHIVKLHGLPRGIISDRDAKFTSAFWEQLFERFGTQLSMSTAYHPQTDGQTERVIRVIEEMLRHFTSSLAQDWNLHLDAVEIAYNSAGHASTGFSPYQLDLGRIPRTPLQLLAPWSQPPYSSIALQDFCTQLQFDIDLARESLLRAQQRQEHYYNLHRQDKEFSEGDLVFLSTKNLQRDGMPYTKLDARYLGPFRISHKLSPLTYRLDLPADLRIHPIINIQRLRLYRGTSASLEDDADTHVSDADSSLASPTSEHHHPPALDIDDDGTPIFAVDRILSKRKRGKGHQYLVQYEGYPATDEHTRWLSASYLQRVSPRLIADFEEA